MLASNTEVTMIYNIYLIYLEKRQEASQYNFSRFFAPIIYHQCFRSQF